MRTTHIGVLQGKTGLGRRRQALDVQAMLQDGFEAAVGQRVDVDGPLACGFQTAFTVSLGQTQNAQATAVALLWMAALMQDVLYDALDVRPDASGPLNQSRRIPPLNGLVGRRHVGVDGGMSPLERTAHMAGDATSPVEHFNCRCSEAGIDLLPCEALRHRVVMAGDFNVVVDTDRHHLPFGEFITRSRQGP